jgi:transposase
MFARRNRNRSGSISVQIIFKKDGRYHVVETVGTSKDPDEIEKLFVEANNRIHFPSHQRPLISVLTKDDLVVKNFIESVSNLQIRTIGPELIFGKLFDKIGFNIVKEELFRHIVIARLAYPTSKLKTADYLYRYQGVRIEEDAIYRFLDKLNKNYKDTVEKVAFEYTKKTLKNIAIVFYDMTTLYFESEDEDDLRKIGFSKDGKFQNPQIMLGLLVGENGYPIGYDVFKGNTFEGHTLIPTIQKIQKKYGFQNPIVVADAGLLSKNNIESLIKENYQFIIGARIKNESETIKSEILKNSKNLEDGNNFFVKKSNGTKLIISYSDKRKKKDAHNREKGLKKLREKVKSGKLAKEHINNRGYNKFLSLNGEVKVGVNEDRVEEDKKWDGLKGYATNSKISSKKIIENYRHLWQIEKAFRISKTDLRIRPIYHYKQKRIESHICIAFVAYTIYKELERLLEKHNAGFSPKRAAELTHNMYEMEYLLPDSKKKEKTILKMDDEQKILYATIQKD